MKDRLLNALIKHQRYALILHSFGLGGYSYAVFKGVYEPAKSPLEELYLNTDLEGYPWHLAL